MMKKIYVLLLVLSIAGCKNEIKNEDRKVEVEEGTAVIEKDALVNRTEEIQPISKDGLLGYWVGLFEKDDETHEKAVVVDEGYIWNRENKINISIDKITDRIVEGHSVVAGNDRPFKGVIKTVNNGYSFEVEEPGDDKYDGTFTFTIANDTLEGTWSAYKEIDIKNRKYSLVKKKFEYDPEVMLELSKYYLDWDTFIETKQIIEYEDEVEEWMHTEFSTTTDLIYEINASNEILSKSVVENLKKGDLTVVRNTIYARHGYSFKNRPLRVFFDAQPWYIPVHNNIRNDFTDIEKQNIELLLKYEKNAAEYYDSFGRG